MLSSTHAAAPPSEQYKRWEIRESCNPIIKAVGYNYKYDLSLPIPQYYEIAEDTRNHLKRRPDAIIVNWGHAIDGNIHLNK